jgi:hypothetical protein
LNFAVVSFDVAGALAGAVAQKPWRAPSSTRT